MGEKCSLMVYIYILVPYLVLTLSARPRSKRTLTNTHPLVEPLPC